jgi:hypothetical protein
MGGLPSEVGAASSFASMLSNDDPWQCIMFVLIRVVWVASDSGAPWASSCT